MHNPKIYKIGTRGSLLALTQCNQVKDQLEKITGDKFELDVIKTQGDLITSAPLWQLDGKDFFTKELDEALLSGRVDLVVHSYKDLGSERPEGITLAAVTKRTYAHDILLIKKSTIAKIKDMKEFFVGTSSPRRMVNLEKNLHSFLPHGSNLKVTSKMLRGNVNTRISKLVNDEFDAVVLALPGIERLALTESSKLELTALLKDMTFMVLPQSIFPSSASQGALGIECRKNRDDNGELFNKLKKMEDAVTVEEVSRERKAFNEYGGGCHLAVGINVKKIDQYFVHTHRGFLNEKVVSENLLEGRMLPQLPKNAKPFLGMPKGSNPRAIYDQIVLKKAIQVELKPNAHYFVSSKYSAESMNEKISYESVWASGTRTWKDLCSKGIWVNGTSDGLGMPDAEHLKNSKAISLMINQNFPLFNLSNENNGSTIKTYERETVSPSNELKLDVLNCDVFYWTSYPQYQTYVEMFPEIKNKIHCAGLGKTFQQFKINNINVLPFYAIEEFENWIKTYEQ